MGLETNQFIEKIKGYINDNNKTFLDEKLFEWKIENWNGLSDMEKSPEFTVNNSKWLLNFYPNGSNNENRGNVSIYLKSLDVEKEYTSHFYTKRVVYIRNYTNNNVFIYGVSSFSYFNKKNDSWGWSDFIKTDELFTKRGNSNQSYVENNKCVIGVFLRIYKYEEEYFKNEIKSIITKENEEIENEGFYEWKVENWNQLSEYEYSPEFTVGNHKWKLKIYPNGTSNAPENYKKFLTSYLVSTDADNDITTHIYVKKILFIRNYNDKTCFTFQEDSDIYYYNGSNISNGSYMEKASELNKKIGNSKKSLVENNRCIIGVYFRIYNYGEEQYKDEIKSLLNNSDDREVESEGFYEWKIENWNSISNDDYSPIFTAGNYKWKIQVYPNGNASNRGSVSIFLNNIDTSDNDAIHICIEFILFIRNINDKKLFALKKSTSYTYFNNNYFPSWGFGNCFKNSELFIKRGNSNKSLVENNKCVIGTYFKIYKYQKDQYKEEIKESIDDESRIVENEGFYEWKIENWNNISNEDYSPEFKIGNYKWKLQLYKDGSNNSNKGSITVLLDSVDSENDRTVHIINKRAIYIRNYYDNGCFIFNKSEIFKYFNNDSNNWGFSLIKASDLLSRKVGLNKYLVENNKCVIGIFLKTYRYENDDYKEEIKSCINDDDRIVKNEGFYEWKIENWNQLSSCEYSPEFKIGNNKWKLSLYPNGNTADDEGNVSLFLKSIDVENNNSLNICTTRVFYIKNYDNNKCIYLDFPTPFVEYKHDCCSMGYPKFITQSKLKEKSAVTNRFLIENNKCIVGIYIRTYKNNNENEQAQKEREQREREEREREEREREQREREQREREQREREQREREERERREIRERIEREEREKMEREIRERIDREKREQENNQRKNSNNEELPSYSESINNINVKEKEKENGNSSSIPQNGNNVSNQPYYIYPNQPFVPTMYYPQNVMLYQNAVPVQYYPQNVNISPNQNGFPVQYYPQNVNLNQNPIPVQYYPQNVPYQYYPQQNISNQNVIMNQQSNPQNLKTNPQNIAMPQPQIYQPYVIPNQNSAAPNQQTNKP